MDLPYLQERYGNLQWSVRNILANFSGWLSGEPQELFPLKEEEKSAKVTELLTDVSNSSAVTKMIASSEKNAAASVKHFEETGEYLYVETQWALEVAQLAFLAADPGSAEQQQAVDAKVNALTLMSSWTSSINAKYYFLTTSVEAQTFDLRLVLPFGQNKDSLVYGMPMKDVLPLYSLVIEPEKCDPTMLERILFSFTDLSETFLYNLRNCVLEFVSDDNVVGAEYDAKVITNSTVWRDILNRQTTITSEIDGNNLEVDGLDSLIAWNATLAAEWIFYFEATLVTSQSIHLFEIYNV